MRVSADVCRSFEIDRWLEKPAVEEECQCTRTAFSVHGLSPLYLIGVSLRPSFLCSSDPVFLFSAHVVDPAGVLTFGSNAGL